MQQAFKTLTDQMNSQNNQFSNRAFSTVSPFPFPPPSASGPTTSPPHPTSPSPVVSQPAITVDVPATKVEAAPSTSVEEEMEVKKEPKKYGKTESLCASTIHIWKCLL